ncbi:NgoPII restriction endonuclease [Bernardetia litoralis DSM 6794]|uniref:NgoPII restriction endonuclease n=1 Tax=Bernardetia litoralis (strain ATCC 23117 / DSM 6794 / NBRC 15988 / NCIMB 1366 / Fx l1 / Sio-4) TaxID=880071 RepID=I4AHT4_BERLS|nr:NgoPII family restriction endonuclease [Bernardetia litoralis]AFM03519.1 NgoPII restriction endonuclease [Bernardetia litoralis DSM 6794]
MTNILEAIYAIIQNPIFEIKSFYTGRNRANSVGDALENYIKDAFANSFHINDEKERMKLFNENFSWLGSQNNPPDIMIKGGDAIEVKKTQTANTNLALNSSYPKSNINSSSPMITQSCKNCEEWTEKDLIYCVGHTTDTTLKSLWMVYGNIYAAGHETYERIKNTISEGIDTIPNVEFAETKELGRVNKVDALGITNLRIRGMWQIQNPRKVFSYLHIPTEKKFELICIIPTSNYNSFDKSSKNKIESINKVGFTIQDEKVKDPNNLAKLIDCKLIKYII